MFRNEAARRILARCSIRAWANWGGDEQMGLWLNEAAMGILPVIMRIRHDGGRAAYRRASDIGVLRIECRWGAWSLVIY